MNSLRTILTALLVGFMAAPAAWAQTAAPGGEPPCMKDFLPLRKDAEQRAAVIRTAMERKAAQPEICQAFKNFAAAEEKVVKFVETNNVWCGVPPEAVKQMKTNHNKTITMRNQVCNSARAGYAAPRPPSLSDALNAPAVPNPATAKTGRGTYDTLTGNPLAR